MKKENKFIKELKEIKFSNFVFLFIAGIINSIGVTLFLAPASLYDSGISGTSMLFWQLTPDQFTLSLFLVVLNIPLFLIGLKKQGINFTIYSIFTVIIYSVSSYIINYILPIDNMSASPFAGHDLLLCAIFGGLISGIGSGLAIRHGGAMDGIEVLAVIFSKKIGITVGTFVMAYNVILYICVGLLTNSYILPLYSIIAYTAGLKAVDFIVEGLDKTKAAMIITAEEEKVCQALSEQFGHGITQLNATGYYVKQKLCAVYFVVNRFQIPKLKSIVKETDPGAFVTITEVSDFMGSSIKKK